MRIYLRRTWLAGKGGRVEKPGTVLPPLPCTGVVNRRIGIDKTEQMPLWREPQCLLVDKKGQSEYTCHGHYVRYGLNSATVGAPGASCD